MFKTTRTPRRLSHGQEVKNKFFQSRASTLSLLHKFLTQRSTTIIQLIYDDRPEHYMYQYQDDVKNLLPVVTVRQALRNNSHKSNQFVPVDYGDLGYQKKLTKDKVYNLGPKQLDFGKYKKFELWWVVKHDTGYINWLTRQPSPSNWLQHILKDVNRYFDLRLKWDRVPSSCTP